MGLYKLYWIHKLYCQSACAVIVTLYAAVCYVLNYMSNVSLTRHIKVNYNFSFHTNSCFTLWSPKRTAY